MPGHPAQPPPPELAAPLQAVDKETDDKVNDSGRGHAGMAVELPAEQTPTVEVGGASLSNDMLLCYTLCGYAKGHCYGLWSAL